MLEASVETYKRKLENLGDLKRQMKLLEENNMTYMQNTVSLEEELRKANAARAQLETYKRQVNKATIEKLQAKIKLQFKANWFGTLTRDLLTGTDVSFQVQELHKKMSEESRRADNLAFEMKKLEEKHEATLKEKEVGKNCWTQLVAIDLLNYSILENFWPTIFQ